MASMASAVSPTAFQKFGVTIRTMLKITAVTANRISISNRRCWIGQTAKPSINAIENPTVIKLFAVNHRLTAVAS